MHRVGRQSGFSMVEVMVVVTVTGLTLAAGVPAFTRFTQTARLNGAAEQIAGEFRLARQKAVSEGTPYIFLWWYSNWYYVIKDTDGNGYYTSGEPYTGPTWFPSGISALSAEGFTSPWMSINPNGSCTQSGSFVIRNARGNRLRLTLLGPTGQVSIAREDGYEAQISL